MCCEKESEAMGAEPTAQSLGLLLRSHPGPMQNRDPADLMLMQISLLDFLQFQFYPSNHRLAHGMIGMVQVRDRDHLDTGDTCSIEHANANWECGTSCSSSWSILQCSLSQLELQ